MSELIVKKYAKALFDSAKENNVLDNVYKDVVSLQDALKEAPDFLKALSNPSLGVSQKERIVSATLKGKINEHFYQFLVFVIHKNRPAFFSDICKACVSLYYQEKNFLEARVTTSIKADQGLCDKVIAHLERKYKKTIVATFKVDPQTIGGIKILIGDRVVDHTVQGQLERFSKNIIYS